MNKIFNKTTKKSGFSLLELFIVILVIWALAASIPPLSFHGKRGIHYSDLRHCFSNQRVLYGALEMYNMDHSEMLVTAFPGREFDDILKLLQDGKYIKEKLTSQDNICSYGFVDLTGSAGVFCVIHGSKETDIYEDTIYPEVDLSVSKPYFEKYNILKIQMGKKSKKFKNHIIFKNEIYDYLLCNPSVPFVLLVIIILSAVISSILSSKKQNKQN